MLDLPATFFNEVRSTVFGGRMTQSQVTGCSLIVEEAIKRRILPNQAANILGQCAPETDFTMEPVREAYFVANTEEAAEKWRKNNLWYYPYYGRGHIQLTLQDNYRAQGARLSLDLVNNPDLVLEWDTSIDIMFYGMMHGSFTGLALPVFVNEQKSDHVNARKVVNGLNKAHEIAVYCRAFERALRDVDFTVPEPEPPAINPRVFELTQIIRDATVELDGLMKDIT